MTEFEETPGRQFSGKRGTKRTLIKGEGPVCHTLTDHNYFLPCQLYSSVMETSITQSHASVGGLHLEQRFESFSLFLTHVLPRK